MFYKSLRRLVLDKRWLPRKKIIVLFFVIAVACYLKEKFFPVQISSEKFCETFNVVYTWVNGSDPEWQHLRQLYSPQHDPARFDDKNELRYSLRSLEKYAPWIDHVYIVTSGQIPYWLNLEYEKVTLIQHRDIVPNADILPTFSSSSIETFIHKIPSLSKRFLYMNDDIFLGTMLYPEDLYSKSEGVKVFNAWTLPDCAIDCPWVYIGDGSCDQHCNIEECQFDGGDCAYDDLHYEKYHHNYQNKNDLLITKNSKENLQPANLFYEVNKLSTKAKTNKTTTNLKSIKARKIIRKQKNSFNDMLRKKNLTNDVDLKKFVESFNKEQKMKLKPHHYELLTEKSPFESTKDIYTHSLLHTNKILNKAYGFKMRNVLAHVGFLLDGDIIDAMEKKFLKSVEETRSHRFRSKNDIQFAFLYYYFLMSETRNITIEEIFNEFDTDKSASWSDREIRTLLTRLYPLPLDWSAVQFFEEVTSNCSQNRENSLNGESSYVTLVYERYEDSNMPTVTKNLVRDCTPLKEALISNFGQKQTYKFQINQRRGMHSNFMMLTSNITEVVESLDKFRRSPRKFNCINDNLLPQYPEENELIKHLLEDFYLSFFPERSKYELPGNYRNRFKYLDEYNKWKSEKRITLFLGYIICAILLLVMFKYFCIQNGKVSRRYLRLKYCDI